MSDLASNDRGVEILLYQREDGESKIEVRLVGETLWLTQNQMADLFQTTKQNVSQHLQAIYDSGELQAAATVKKFLTVRQEGGRQVSRDLEHYNLDADKPNMGMTSWSPGRIRKGDASIAKNYLTAEEIDVLNRVVTAYLELAELQALNRQPMYMRDWITRLDDFLKMTGREILSHAGTASHEEALAKAQAEYDKYHQKHLNDPSPVEKHFIEAVEEAKRLGKEHSKPSGGGAE